VDERRRKPRSELRVAILLQPKVPTATSCTESSYWYVVCNISIKPSRRSRNACNNVTCSRDSRSMTESPTYHLNTYLLSHNQALPHQNSYCTMLMSEWRHTIMEFNLRFFRQAAAQLSFPRKGLLFMLKPPVILTCNSPKPHRTLILPRLTLPRRQQPGVHLCCSCSLNKSNQQQLYNTYLKANLDEWRL
jgi:hypothetical protein